MEQAYRPAKDLRDATVIISSTTTSAGNVGGTTLIDTALTQAESYWVNMAVVILSGNSIGQIRRISAFTAASDTVTVDTAFATQIASGTKYNIVAQHLITGGTPIAATDIGVRQVFEKSITVAANAGATTVGTITTQACVIESIINHADAAQTADLTSCAITGGASGVITFIDAATAIRENLDAADKQVTRKGAVRLAATKTIVITPVGTGATALDLTIIITYYSSSANGGTIS